MPPQDEARRDRQAQDPPPAPRRRRITPAAAGVVGATTSGIWGVVTEFVPFVPARVAAGAAVGGLGVWAAVKAFSAERRDTRDGHR